MNETIETPKVTAKGLIKVELFDDVTGRKVEEVNTHNFIAQGVLKNLFNAKVNDIFTKGRATNAHEVSSVFNDPFAQISLTTAKHPEDPLNEWLRAGKLIGYAYSDASFIGSDVLRGNYNIVESFTKGGHIRMVFDFPTNVSNGEIGSIYFHPKTDAHNRLNQTSRQELLSVNSFKKYGDFYYILKNKELQKYDTSWILRDKHVINDDFICDFEIVEDVIYYVRFTAANAIQKAHLDNPSILTNVIDIPNSVCGGITFDNDSSQFIIGDYSGDLKKIRYYDKNFNPIRILEGLNIATNAYNGALNKNGDFLIVGKEIMDVNGNISTIEYDKIIGLTDNEIITPGYIFPKTYIGSRCLLDAPITKTDKQTMKITYDFKLPSIY